MIGTVAKSALMRQGRSLLYLAPVARSSSIFLVLSKVDIDIAMSSAVLPRLFRALTSAPALMSTLTISGFWLNCAAMESGVEPYFRFRTFTVAPAWALAPASHCSTTV